MEGPLENTIIESLQLELSKHIIRVESITIVGPALTPQKIYTPSSNTSVSARVLVTLCDVSRQHLELILPNALDSYIVIDGFGLSVIEITDRVRQSVERDAETDTQSAGIVSQVSSLLGYIPVLNRLLPFVVPQDSQLEAAEGDSLAQSPSENMDSTRIPLDKSWAACMFDPVDHQVGPAQPQFGGIIELDDDFEEASED